MRKLRLKSLRLRGLTFFFNSKDFTKVPCPLTSIFQKLGHANCGHNRHLPHWIENITGGPEL